MNTQPAPQQTQLPKLRQTWYGPEKLCSKCLEYWPADPEFFYRVKGRLRSICKACCDESKAQRRRGLSS